MSDSTRPRRRVVAAPARRPPAELHTLRVVVEDDPEPDTGYLGVEELAERRAAYERGEFSLLCLRVEADVSIESTEQLLVSPGCRGIESDAEPAELEALAVEEYEALRKVLKMVGVPTDGLPPATAETVRALEWRT